MSARKLAAGIAAALIALPALAVESDRQKQREFQYHAGLSDCRQGDAASRTACEQGNRDIRRATREAASRDSDFQWRSQQLQLALQRCDILSGSTRHACIAGSREEFLN